MEWKKYEREIFRYFRDTFPDTSIKYDQHIIGKFSKVSRQVDILIEGEIVGFEIKIVVDCKYFSKNIDVKSVESFCSMIEDLDAHQGILITQKGYSKAAINRAFYGNHKVELDIINFDDIKNYQGLLALPYSGHNTVILPAPFGWVIDTRNKINGIASLYQRGSNLKEAQKRLEWMYLEFWKKNDDIKTIDELIEFQNSYITEGKTANFQYPKSLKRSDGAETKIRVADVEKYPCLEVTGYVDSSDFIFFSVLFTPKELLDRNIRKLKYLLNNCKPGKLTFDNTLVIKQSLEEIKKLKSNQEIANRYHEVGEWYFEMDEIENALKYFRKSLEHFPTHYGFLKHIIGFELKYGELDESLKHASYLLDIEPQNPTVPNDLVEMFLEKNNNHEALTSFFQKKINNLNDDHAKANILFHKGLFELNLELFGDAKSSFENSEKLFRGTFDKEHEVFDSINKAYEIIKTGHNNLE